MGKAKLTIEKRTQNGGLKEGRLFSLSALKWALSTMPPSFPEQGWNLRPLQWKCRVLTTGPPGKSQSGHFSLETDFVLWSHWGPSFRRCLQWCSVPLLCCVCSVGPTLCGPMDCARQAPQPMEFSRQECWNGLPCPSPGDLSHLGTEPVCVSCLGRRVLYHWATWEAMARYIPAL